MSSGKKVSASKGVIWFFCLVQSVTLLAIIFAFFWEIGLQDNTHKGQLTLLLSVAHFIFVSVPFVILAIIFTKTHRHQTNTRPRFFDLGLKYAVVGLAIPIALVIVMVSIVN